MKIPVVVRPPFARSPLRRRLGRFYFQWKRRARWFFGPERFALQKEAPFACCLFQHQTPLLRRLKDVDMQLQYNKITNLRLAAACIDGVVLHPGEIFSFWRLVGKPTAQKGYLEGLVLENGKIGRGVGGGLCQLGNLLYWMALHSPLTVTERWRHSYDVFPDANRVLPFGSGATLAYNYIDLQLKNETNQAFQFRVCVSETDLQGELLSSESWPLQYAVFEKEHFMQQEHWGGFSRHNQIWRNVSNAGVVLRTELVAENHAVMMYRPFLGEGELSVA